MTSSSHASIFIICICHLWAGGLNNTVAPPSLLDVDDVPVAVNASVIAASKEAMVETFEALATQCGDSLRTANGIRKFGGHIARVTGAQALTGCGIDVEKVKILARHSSDAMYRYVREAPLTTFKQDLGLVKGLTISSEPVAKAHQCQSKVAAAHFKGALTRLDDVGKGLLHFKQRLDQPSELYVLNTESSAVHRVHPSDKSMTACGWHYMCKRRAKGTLKLLENIDTYPWWASRAKCLQPKRNQLREQALYSYTDSE